MQEEVQMLTGKIVHKKDFSFTFLHSRLSLIDLNERANQPMEDNEGIISFNGEIYNFIELRQICKEKGASFKTSSDTEVLLKILNIFGAKGLKT